MWKVGAIAISTATVTVAPSGAALADVAALGARELHDPLVHVGDVGGHALVTGDVLTLEVHADALGRAEPVHEVGGGDEGLAGDAVGQHGGPSQPRPLGQDHLGPELRRGQGGLVATRAATDDDDGLPCCTHGPYPTIVTLGP